jgi:hypothetical protein
LKEWAINRIYDSILFKQERIKLDTLIEVRSYHIDKKLFTKTFDNSKLNWLIKERKRLFYQNKAKRLLIVEAAKKEAERCELNDEKKRWERHLCSQTRLNLNKTVEMWAYLAWHHQHSFLHAIKAKKTSQKQKTPRSNRASPPACTLSLIDQKGKNNREELSLENKPKTRAKNREEILLKQAPASKKQSKKRASLKSKPKRWASNRSQKMSPKSEFKKMSSKSKSKDEPQIRVKKRASSRSQKASPKSKQKDERKFSSMTISPKSRPKYQLQIEANKKDAPQIRVKKMRGIPRQK